MKILKLVLHFKNMGNPAEINRDETTYVLKTK